jgi:hypothetical protein
VSVKCRRVCDLLKDNGVNCGEPYAYDYGSEGWGFESLRARKTSLVTSLPRAFRCL